MAARVEPTVVDLWLTRWGFGFSLFLLSLFPSLGSEKKNGRRVSRSSLFGGLNIDGCDAGRRGVESIAETVLTSVGRAGNVLGDDLNNGY